MTALIKTIIAAIIGMFGSLEMEQSTPMEITGIQIEKKCAQGRLFTPEVNCGKEVISWEYINSSSAS
ncbi:hypothetical protein FK178_06120 [Antarcticibacterium arcticum]|uniref:Uncharacterized protein n=1 Tax=Antarcticibacterium arcticum TaxID=2585771 RepID=A0A5B8YM15_9FLAO|nr:hypothetical protein [Antarcticibacterium arcticum]QED37316.1 hypothetical protein FK178_06120 [Antarcticibacterium arcticum]